MSKDPCPVLGTRTSVWSENIDDAADLAWHNAVKELMRATKALKRFNPDQPREAAGSPVGGQWTGVKYPKGIKDAKDLSGGIKGTTIWAVALDKKDILTAPYYMPHNEMIAIVHGESRNVDNYVRFENRGGLYGDTYSAAVKVLTEDDQEKALDNIYAALDFMAARGLPKDTPVKIEVITEFPVRGEPKLQTITTTVKSLLSAIKNGFDPNQPRVPKDNPDGGQWTDESESDNRIRKITKYLDVPESVDEFMKPYWDVPYEYCCMIDKSGKPVRVMTQTSPDTVAYTEAEWENMRKAGSMTHNHPSGSPLSTADLKAAQVLDMDMVQCFGTDITNGKRVSYTARRPEGGWPTSMDIEVKDYMMIQIGRIKYQSEIQDGPKLSEKQDRILQRTIFKEMQQKFFEVLNIPLEVKYYD